LSVAIRSHSHIMPCIMKLLCIFKSMKNSKKKMIIIHPKLVMSDMMSILPASKGLL
jgi:hypothetical protein